MQNKCCLKDVDYILNKPNKHQRSTKKKKSKKGNRTSDKEGHAVPTWNFYNCLTICIFSSKSRSYKTTTSFFCIYACLQLKHNAFKVQDVVDDDGDEEEKDPHNKHNTYMFYVASARTMHIIMSKPKNKTYALATTATPLSAFFYWLLFLVSTKHNA